MLDLSSDLSAANDSDDDDIQIIEAPSSAQTLRKKDPKGKGKAVARQSDDDSMEYGDDSIDEEESEEDVKKIRSLAKALGKKATVRKGSGTSSPATFAVVVEGPAKKDASAKGKGKKVVAELEDGEGSALAPSPGSDIEMPSWLAEDDDEDGSDDENGGEGADAGMSNGKWGKTTLKKAPRKGAVIPRDLKVRMKKMSKVRLVLGHSSSLRLMLYPLQFDKTQVMLKANHPELADCWEQLEALPRSVPTLAKQPGGLTQTLLPFQREGLDWMVKQEAGPFGGGMLADEYVFLLLSFTVSGADEMIVQDGHGQDDPDDRPYPLGSQAGREEVHARPHSHCCDGAVAQRDCQVHEGLQGAPLFSALPSLVADYHVSQVYEFHGASRIDNVKELEKYDVVLTTCALLPRFFLLVLRTNLETCRCRHGVELPSREQGVSEEGHPYERGLDHSQNQVVSTAPPSLVNVFADDLRTIRHRVILDEAHNIKDRGSNTAKAAFALRAKFRWCLSGASTALRTRAQALTSHFCAGTPLQNRVGELYSLIRFIGADPFSYYFCKQCDCKSLHWLSHKGPCSECRHSGMQVRRFRLGSRSRHADPLLRTACLLLEQRRPQGELLRATQAWRR